MDTTIFSQINWLAVLCGALAYFILGALWYSKLLFANKWIELTGVDASNPEAKKDMGPIMLASFVLMFLTALGIAILNSKLGLIGGWMSGIKLGLTTGLLFGATAISISYLYEKRPTGLHFINGAYTVVGNILAAIVICSWG
jgi:MFS family permease